MDKNEQAPQELCMDVDVMILDYLVDKAIEAILHETQRERSTINGDTNANSESHLEMVDSILSLFKYKYPAGLITEQLSVRLQILTFSNLFFRRFMSSQYLPSVHVLRAQRQKNTSRAVTWIRSHQSEVFPSSRVSLGADFSRSLRSHRQSMLVHMGVPHDSNTPDLDLIPTLLDAVPEFMKLFYMLPECKTQLTDAAVNLMLQAVLEQVFVYGQEVTQSVNEAFSWDWREDNGPDARGPACAAWGSSKLSMKTLILQAINVVPPTSGLKGLLHQYPLRELNGLMAEALENCTDTLTAPALVQLDGGKFKGLIE